MPAPNQSSRTHHAAIHHTGPLRLRMTETRGRNQLDGVWWPRSRDLGSELTDLVDHFPDDRLGRVVRVLVSPPDWDSLPRHVLVRGGYVGVTAFPQAENTHVVHLATSYRSLLKVVVVPPEFTRSQGDEAMKAATTSDDLRSADTLLQQVVDHPAVLSYGSRR